MADAPDIAGLRDELDHVLVSGMADDPVLHAAQVGAVTAIVSRAFAKLGLRCTLVGGSAIEVHAPGILKSGDIDLVVESVRGEPVRETLDAVFRRLGFDKSGRHWSRKNLLIEVPGSTLDEAPETHRVGQFTFNVLSKEALLAERIAGFKHWKQTSYGQQAIDMIAAFGDELRWELLAPKLAREACLDAFEALRNLARSDAPVTEGTLRRLLGMLTGGAREAT